MNLRRLPTLALVVAVFSLAATGIAPTAAASHEQQCNIAQGPNFCIWWEPISPFIGAIPVTGATQTEVVLAVAGTVYLGNPGTNAMGAGTTSSCDLYSPQMQCDPDGAWVPYTQYVHEVHTSLPVLCLEEVFVYMTLDSNPPQLIGAGPMVHEGPDYRDPVPL